MREPVDREKLYAFMDALGGAATGAGTAYLVGGSSALLLNVRLQTIDVDLKLDPEPRGVFEAIALLKEQFKVNVELASPSDFMPELRGWRERSEFIRQSGLIRFYHYDFYAQVLSKLLRGHTVDLQDAKAFVSERNLNLDILSGLFDEIKPSLIRYPAIDATEFAGRVSRFVEESSL